MTRSHALLLQAGRAVVWTSPDGKEKQGQFVECMPAKESVQIIVEGKYIQAPLGQVRLAGRLTNEDMATAWDAYLRDIMVETGRKRARLLLED